MSQGRQAAGLISVLALRTTKPGAGVKESLAEAAEDEDFEEDPAAAKRP